MNNENRKYQYWMKCISGIGNKKLKKLVEYCGSAKEAYKLTEKQLLEIEGIYEKDAQAVLKSRETHDLEKELRILEKTGTSMITIEDADFPEKLREISDCPYALFYKGTLPVEEEKTAAVVGARMCSSYGRSVSLAVGRLFAENGVAVVSGMAYGIDSFAHWGAIRGGGRTYAVLGCGPDICYPKGGIELYRQIQENGALLSEYPPKTKPAAGHFPARNRLISALSDIVVVVEAKKKSGSLITADFALEQGKEIYAVPGRLGDSLSAGCNDLIRQGSGIAASLEDLLLEFGISHRKRGKEQTDTKKPLEKEELMVYSCFDLYPKNLEELFEMTKIPVPRLADLLVRLQAKDMIEEYYKNYYRKK